MTIEIKEVENREPCVHDYNEQGYCKKCGELNRGQETYIGWPTGTWFQDRLKKVQLERR